VGPILLRRRFGRPRQLDAHEHVWLTIAGMAGELSISLNGQPLGTAAACSGSAEFEVTHLLHERNEVTIEVRTAPPAADRWGDVALEVRCPAYLRSVRTEMESAEDGQRLHVRGEVVGAAEGLLELYVLANRAVVAYLTVEADPAGQAFHVCSEFVPLAVLHPGVDPAVRVELVCGAVVWYAVDLPRPAD
jgi:hypothetical protein